MNQYYFLIDFFKVNSFGNFNGEDVINIFIYENNDLKLGGYLTMSNDFNEYPNVEYQELEIEQVRENTLQYTILYDILKMMLECIYYAYYLFVEKKVENSINNNSLPIFMIDVDIEDTFFERRNLLRSWFSEFKTILPEKNIKYLLNNSDIFCSNLLDKLLGIRPRTLKETIREIVRKNKTNIDLYGRKIPKDVIDFLEFPSYMGPIFYNNYIERKNNSENRMFLGDIP